MSSSAPVWWHPELAGKEREHLDRVLQSGFLNDGPLSREVETHVQDLLSVKHAVVTTNCTTALFLGLVALGVGPGDEVVVPDITFIASANAVRLAGARVVLADVEWPSGLLDVNSVEQVITPKTRAVMPVHLNGRSANMQAVCALAKKHGLFVVEDAAEALFSKGANTNYLGCIGEVGCFSLSPNKLITAGQGGILVTNNTALAETVHQLKDQGRTRRGTGTRDVHESEGYNFKFTDLQAAVALAQLEVLPARAEKQRQIAKVYEDELSQAEGIVLHKFDFENKETPLWCDIMVEDAAGLESFMTEKGFGSRRYWYPLHTQGTYLQTEAPFPVSTRIGEKGIWLPSHFSLPLEQIKEAAQWVKQFCAK